MSEIALALVLLQLGFVSGCLYTVRHSIRVALYVDSAEERWDALVDRLHPLTRRARNKVRAARVEAKRRVRF